MYDDNDIISRTSQTYRYIANTWPGTVAEGAELFDATPHHKLRFRTSLSFYTVSQKRVNFGKL